MPNMLSRWVMLVTLLACFQAREARADAVNPPPDACASGGVPSTCHGGPHCAAVACTSDADCTQEDTVCRELAVCIGKINCAGLIGPGEDAFAYGRDTVEGACPGGTGCKGKSKCETKRVCVQRTAAGGGGSGPGATGGRQAPQGGQSSGGAAGAVVDDEEEKDNSGCAVRAVAPARRASLLLIMLGGALALSRRFARHARG